MVDMAASDWPIRKHEEDLRRTADEDLPMLALADEVSRLLAETIQSIRIDAAREDRSAKDFRVHALWFMAIITLRALRAAMQVLRSATRISRSGISA